MITNKYVFLRYRYTKRYVWRGRPGHESGAASCCETQDSTQWGVQLSIGALTGRAWLLRDDRTKKPGHNSPVKAQRGVCIKRGLLPQRQGVAEDQPRFIHIAAEVAAHRGVAHFQAEVFQGATLDDISDIGVAFPFLAFTQARSALDVVAAQVTGHQAQPGNAQGGEVIVVTNLP